ncbi:DUF4349 domain-containing protein [Nakamurella sp. PAMC28650]|uniref:DUF4349 domain-containing protein n=1 Tax=Nakamurella sp. PAMC28650 TaxID=2762325 RepID=UPI00164DF2B0|nr:DUF4349 domain-containing protein [Nakamurella sp. PAMC28650]QNK81299.1 DUF4349 domain-containing protein [Nakamurella sp. PAMC28650]
MRQQLFVRPDASGNRSLLEQAVGREGRATRRRLIRWAAVTVAAAVLMAVVAGCTSPPEPTSAAAGARSEVGSAAAGSAAGSAPGSAPAGSAAGSAPAGSAAAGPASGEPSAAGTSAAAAPSGSASATGSGGGAAGTKGALDVAAGLQAAARDVIRTATLTLQIPVTSTGTTAAAKAADAASEQTAVNDASTRVRSLVASGPGFVGSSDGGGTTVSITLRVPVSGYDSVMGGLTSIGTMTARKENTQDVTGQMLDIGSRMKTMADSISQVRILLTKATRISDIIAIESELSGREADFESLKSQQAGLADQTSLSTITVVLQGAIVGVPVVVPPPTPAPPVARTGFFGGLANGWDAVRHIGHAVLTVVGTLIPFLPVVFVIAIAVMIWRRRLRAPAAPVPAATAADPHPGG